MTSIAGRQLLHYQVLDKLGEGGMGVVYRAIDTHLDRPVAIKVLRAETVAHEDRKRRFVLEAHAASALNHPNIITVHDIASDGGLDFMVMEYVEGRPLDELIPRKGMRLEHLLKIAIQIADALAAAHGRGIIHRDLKPANIMVTGSGLVKVLDFGLAKLTEPTPRQPDATCTQRLDSDAGTIAGTAAYMSPEQADGSPLDPRSDIFSFGVMLYEMATGQQPFRAETHMKTLSAVLTSEAPPLADVPHDLEKIITRCLRKDPARRFQHMDDIAIALRDLKEESDSGKLSAPAVPVPRRRGRRALAMTHGVVILLIGAVLVWWFVLRRPSVAPVNLVPLTTHPGDEIAPAFSPDGKQVAFSWNGPDEDNYDIYVNLIGTSTLARLTTDTAADRCPVWSPDGRRIAFVRGGEKPSVMVMPALGGPARALAETGADHWLLTCGIDWSPDGRFIAFPAAPSSQIVLLSPDTGERRAVSFPASNTLGDAQPRFSPDGTVLAFLRQRSDAYHGIGIVPLAGGGKPARTVSPQNARVRSLAWSRDGRELIFTGDYEGARRIWRMPADGSAPPAPVLGVGPNPSGNGLAISPQGGLLAYTQSMADANVWRLDLEDSRPVGAPRRVIASTWLDSASEFSPDGQRIVFGSNRSGALEIWVAAADGSNPLQLTDTRGPETGSPHWSPDGRKIAFDCNREGQAEIYTVNSDGGPIARITHHPGVDAVPTWSRDGRWLYFTSNRSGEHQIWKVSAEGGDPVQVTRHGGVNAFESADGKTIYYAKGLDQRGIWKVPAGGGEETAVLDSPGPRRWGYMDVHDTGIYFVEVVREGKRPQYGVFFYSFATRITAPIALLEKQPPAGARGLSVARGGRALLYTQLDASGTDLMLIENFR